MGSNKRPSDGTVAIAPRKRRIISVVNRPTFLREVHRENAIADATAPAEIKIAVPEDARSTIEDNAPEAQYVQAPAIEEPVYEVTEEEYVEEVQPAVADVEVPIYSAEEVRTEMYADPVEIPAEQVQTDVPEEQMSEVQDDMVTDVPSIEEVPLAEQTGVLEEDAEAPVMDASDEMDVPASEDMQAEEPSDIQTESTDVIEDVSASAEPMSEEAKDDISVPQIENGEQETAESSLASEDDIVIDDQVEQQSEAEEIQEPDVEIEGGAVVKELDDLSEMSEPAFPTVQSAETSSAAAVRITTSQAFYDFDYWSDDDAFGTDSEQELDASAEEPSEGSVSDVPAEEKKTDDIRSEAVQEQTAVEIDDDLGDVMKMTIPDVGGDEMSMMDAEVSDQYDADVLDDSTPDISYQVADEVAAAAMVRDFVLIDSVDSEYPADDVAAQNEEVVPDVPESQCGTAVAAVSESRICIVSESSVPACVESAGPLAVVSQVDPVEEAFISEAIDYVSADSIVNDVMPGLVPEVFEAPKPPIEYVIGTIEEERVCETNIVVNDAPQIDYVISEIEEPAEGKTNIVVNDRPQIDYVISEIDSVPDAETNIVVNDAPQIDYVISEIEGPAEEVTNIVVNDAPQIDYVISEIESPVESNVNIVIDEPQAEVVPETVAEASPAVSHIEEAKAEVFARAAAYTEPTKICFGFATSSSKHVGNTGIRFILGKPDVQKEDDDQVTVDDDDMIPVPHRSTFGNEGAFVSSFASGGKYFI